jgi:SET domain-containing protein
MYIVPVEVRESSIEGRGVFAAANIKKGQIVWQFTKHHDIEMTPEEFDRQDKETRQKMQRVAYLSPASGLWVSPPENDPACYTNHSRQNNTTVVVDANISPEPYFVANRDIQKSEEITNNYYEFDLNTQKTKPTWT